VRFGLRAANDPRILNTVKVIEAILRTAAGSVIRFIFCWPDAQKGVPTNSEIHLFDPRSD
jgi:GH15 family glucan-1,4-alpha-glucosidase